MAGIWDDMFDEMDSFHRRFERLLSDVADGDVRTYGYTMVQGPDGIPHVHEFGNAAGDRRLAAGAREPLADVSEDGGKVRVTVEVPGVSKDDIELEGGKDSITVSVRGPRSFTKTLALPCDVDPDSAAATYNNGILEVELASVDAKPRGRRIPIA